MSAAVHTAAQALLAARRAGKPIATLPDGCAPQTLAEAYAIQDEVAKSMSPIRGWKVGPSPDGKDLFTAPLFADTFVAGPDIPAASLNQPLLEAEVAFRLRETVSSDIPPSDLLEKMIFVPLFEIIGSRFTDLFKTPMMSLLADNNASALIHTGQPVENWRDIAPERLQFQIDANGKTVESFNYADKMKAGIELATAVVKSKDKRTRALTAGTIITTGSMCKPFLAAGDVVANYGPLGVNRIIMR